jgi:hypothetical protein
MIINNSNFEDLLKSFLQKKLLFKIDDKTIKTGKVLLFTQKYFYISFLLTTAKKKQEKFEIPIPFNFESSKDNKQILLDYRISTLAQNNNNALLLLEKKFNNNLNIKNKFFNKILSIQILHE